MLILLTTVFESKHHLSTIYYYSSIISPSQFHCTLIMFTYFYLFRRMSEHGENVCVEEPASRVVACGESNELIS